MDTTVAGIVNGPVVGIVMKEMVRRAMRSIAANRQAFEATEKESYKPSRDFFTNADTEAQKICLKTITECFPGFGVIAEEDNLRIPCTIPGVDMYFTLDPLDGTKAFMRRQSHGIGTMISLISGDEIIAACVGDVMTGEIYYYRPDSRKVHRLSLHDEMHEVLVAASSGDFTEEYALLGEDPRLLSKEIQDITDPYAVRPVFKSIEIMGGSIGLKVARLWKGEVGAVIVKAGVCTPWDWCPVAGISKKLGFVMLTKGMSGVWSVREFKPITAIGVFDTDMIIVHADRVTDLLRTIE